MATQTRPQNHNGAGTYERRGGGAPPKPASPTDGSWREWMFVGLGLSALMSLVATIVSVVALANPGGGSTTTIIRQATPAAGASAAAIPATSVSMTIKADYKPGSDGKKHDAFLGNTNLSVKPGQTVHVTIANYDDMPHSFTSPALAAGAPIPAGEQQMQGTPQDLKVMPEAGVGVDQTIPGATKSGPGKVTFTFTAPKKAGEYVWYCKMPCDPWAMARYGYMRGHVTVTA